MRPLDRPPTAAFGLLLTVLAHAVGWPVIEGGSARLTEALASELVRSGAEIVVGETVRDLKALPPARLFLLDVTPLQFLALAGDRLPARYRQRLRRFRFGPGVCKLDWALSAPVPWSNAICREAGTVHLGGSFESITQAEADVFRGRHPSRPFVIVAQPGVVDASRAPSGRQTLWAYCHVPAGSDVDMTNAVEMQIERFAPGFRELVLARSVRTAKALSEYDANYIGGDINGGAATLRQTLLRPVAQWNPYRTPLTGVYLCSASTPPGGGVHGMSGWHAANQALREWGSGRLTPDFARRR